MKCQSKNIWSHIFFLQEIEKCHNRVLPISVDWVALQHQNLECILKCQCIFEITYNIHIIKMFSTSLSVLEESSSTLLVAWFGTGALVTVAFLIFLRLGFLLSRPLIIVKWIVFQCNAVVRSRFEDQ